MSKKPYSHILDAIAGDQIRKDLDLAPKIIARIQKGKGFRMQPKTKLVSAILLFAIALVVLFYTVPGMAAAISNWFGYVPGVGLVREGQVRILAEPVSVTREGVTVTVEQVILNQERTALVYSVEGLSNAALMTQPEETICPYAVSLRLPESSTLLASPEGIQSWSSGYQHRFNFPTVPASVNDAQLVISCLFHTRPGAAPENWEIPLHFVPAPADMTTFPVIEIPPPTAPAAMVTHTASATEGTASGTGVNSAQLTLTLDRAVQMDDGYLLYATLHWEDSPFTSVDVTDPEETLQLLDGSGQEMLYEVHYDEQTGMNWDQRQTVFAIKTAPVQTPGPLTLVLNAVSVDLPVDASFVFDPGPAPRAGQEWQPNREITIGERRLLVRSILAVESGYEFSMTSDTGILNAGLIDFEHEVVSGYCSGSGNSPEIGFGCGFNYANGLPDGPVTVSITSIGVRYTQQMQVQWTPPAASTTLLPTQPAACLTASGWKAIPGQQPALPDGLSGKILTNGPSDENWTGGEWQLSLNHLDGSNRQVIPGAQDGALSPDGTKLAYSTLGAGLSVQDLTNGQVTPVPGTIDGDFNPFWSPDGRQIVFNRGMGIFDLFIVDLDGSNMRPLTQGGVQEWPVGWLTDGKHLIYSVPGRLDEYTLYQVDVSSGESQEFSHDNIVSIAPNGKQIITMEKTFGERWLVYISELDGSNRWLLNDSSLWVLSPTWSPDGQWLLIGVSDTDASSTVGVLVNLLTCQVIPMPHLHGNFIAWAP